MKAKTIKNIYIFQKKSVDDPNSYLQQLENSLSQNFNIVNKAENKTGVLDIFKYLFKTDVFYFNWIENLPQNKYGKSQSLIFFYFLKLAKCFHLKILWTLHNKYSHGLSKNYWTDFMYRILIKHSDLILTHSLSGIEFVKTYFPEYSSKVKYFVHPILETLPNLPDQEKTYDFLIWGEVHPYKGVKEFLEFVNKSEEMEFTKILIIGKCLNEEYKIQLERYLSKNITYYNEFLELEEISKFASKSKFILFTYKRTSILSSGSLMDSIRMHSLIIGPNDGAFKDLGQGQFVYTYNQFEDLIEILRNYQYLKNNYIQNIEKFCRENTWQAFSNKLSEEIVGILQ